MPTVVISNNSSGADFSGNESTWMQEDQPLFVHGTDGGLEAHRYGSGGHRHSCIKFSGLSNIPGGSTITAVTLDLYIGGGANSGTDASYQDGLYPLLRNWVEADVSWNIYSGANAWDTPGGTGAADSSSTADAQLVIGTSASGYVQFASTAALVASVQAIVNGGNNYGWLLRKDGGGTNDASYRAFQSDNGTDGQRPKLTVTYTAGGGGSVLSSRLSLLGVGR